MKKYKAVAKYLLNLIHRKQIIETLSKEQLRAIIEIVYNVMQGVCPLSKTNKNLLSKHKTVIRKVIVPRLTVKERRKRFRNINKILPIFLKSYLQYVA